MSGYEIGISGLNAAQKALEVIGNNIANAATEGYHRQRVELRPREEVFTGSAMVGQGVEVVEVVRMINEFLDDNVLKQESAIYKNSYELGTLQTLESAFGELSMGDTGLSVAISDYFNAMHELAMDPISPIKQSTAIMNAESMTNQFRSLGTMVTSLESNTYREAQSTIEEVNLLADQIAQLNDDISGIVVRGGDPNNMLDQRDSLITDLGRIVSLTTIADENGVVNIIVSNISLVNGSDVNHLEVGLDANGSYQDIYIAQESSTIHYTSVSGGRLSGILNMNNSVIRDVGDKLDALASTIVNETNQLHVQGVGSSGSFTELTGWEMSGSTLADYVPPITDGETLYLRVTDSGGVVTRHEVVIDTTDTLADMRNTLGALTGIDNAQTAIINGKLKIVATSGWTFDFLPGVLEDPVNGTSTMAGGGAPLQGAPTVKMSGNYTGTSNLTYVATVVGTGDIGSGSLVVNITESGNPIASINVGSGYSANDVGTPVDIGDGVSISFSNGYLNNGETFDISLVADSDQSGFLKATGLNCFFGGNTAESIGVLDWVSDPVTGGGHIASSKSVWQTDSENTLAMAQIGDTAVSALGSLTPKEYYTDIVTDIGGQVAITQKRENNAREIWRSLGKQRDETSGVDMNDEAAKMLLFERLFQAMAKYMNTLAQMMDSLMTITT